MGGAIYISGVAATTPDVNIDRSLFAGNVARGGDYCDSLSYGLAGLGEGGAIHNGGVLTVEHSTFRDNQAIGGDHNTGNSYIGLGFAGAIANGGSSASEVLTVSGSTFDHNLALGGNYNTATSGRGTGRTSGLAAPSRSTSWLARTATASRTARSPTTRPSAARAWPGRTAATRLGGALAIDALNSPTNVTVSDCMIDHNDAIGGPGGIGGNGGSGEGGGIASVATFIIGFNSTLVVNNTTVDHNQALGGAGGGKGGHGGDGWGGGIASVGTSDAVLTGGPAEATLNVSNTTVDHNKAQGGDGVVGGNGYGGGLYNGEESTFTLTDVTVQFNFAIGGSGSGGTDGDGVGGGVYNIGTFDSTHSSKYVIKKNHASTSNPDSYGL